MAHLAHVHPRLGIGPFKKFEPFFIEALKMFPQTTKITIEGGLSPSTVSARMRDSLLGYRLNRWDAADPEFKSLYERHEGKFVIAGPDRDMNVWFRERRPTGDQKYVGVPFNEAQGHLGRYIKVKPIVPSTAPDAQAIRITGVPDVKQIATLATMKASGAIADPVIFTGDIRSEATAELESSADIVFHFDPVKNETILM